MIGPDSTTLIHLGAKFNPCQFAMNPPFINTTLCPAAYQNVYPLEAVTAFDGSQIICGNLNEYCGLSTFAIYNVGNQWYRPITAIFLHGGVIHFIMNMLFQVLTGYAMERDMGFIRMFFMYMLSGVGGFLFASVFAPSNVSVGCSGALLGLVAALLLDLINNWRLVANPKRTLAFLIIMIIVTFGIGLLPWFDNWAHIGGFVIGLFSSCVFLPQISFGKWDRRRKVILIFVAIPIIIAIYFGLIYALMNEVDILNICPNCHYINCLPLIPGCQS